MKKDKTFDSVKIMREIRDKMSQEMKGMTSKQQMKYLSHLKSNCLENV